jgi:hypothetical protein
MMDGFLTLRKILEDLDRRVNESYADRIEKAFSMRVVDKLEEAAHKDSYEINHIISLAETYLPELIDAELIREVVISPNSPL